MKTSKIEETFNKPLKNKNVNDLCTYLFTVRVFVDSKQPRNPQKFEPLKINYTLSDQCAYKISSNSDIIGRQSLGLLVIICFGGQLVAM